MVTRIGDLGRGQRLQAALLQTQARVKADEQAVASGKAAASYAGIGDASGLLLRAEDARRAKAAFVEHNERLELRLRTADAALASVVGVAERARALVVQRLDGATGRDVALDVEAEAMLAEVVGALNTTHGGDYLFAGSRTGTAPVALPGTPVTVADPSLWYQGDDVRPAARVDTGTELEHGILASDPPFAELIGALGAAAEAHRADDHASLSLALDRLGSALEGLIGVRATLGVNSARLESVTEAQRSGLAYLDETVSGIEDTDLPEVIARLARDRAGLEATYLVTGRLQGLSLADYLR